MQKKHVLVFGVALTAVAAGTAMAQPVVRQQKPVTLRPAPPQTAVQKVTWACPPMISPGLTSVETDWLLNSPQGWFEHAEIAQGTTVKMLRCYYGIDRASPSARPAYFIHRAIPANYTGCALDAPANTSMTCTVP